MRKILVIGALGQIGSELTMALGDRYGYKNIVATDLKSFTRQDFIDKGIFFDSLNCLDMAMLERIVKRCDIGTIYHLAAILSANAEKDPNSAWMVNMSGLLNVLNIAKDHDCSVFVPSSIAAFGPSTPKNDTPQDTIQCPRTIYGITKLSGELLCNYYFEKYDVDVRGVRYPGIISNVTKPGGGTTDYAVEIFYSAIKDGIYTCYLESWTCLDMMYMPDAVKAAIQIMEADSTKLVHRNAFNVSAMSFTPNELYHEIKKLIPSFTVNYKIDPVRQNIAKNWPKNMDDSAARREWGWRPDYDLEKMTEDMVLVLTKRLKSRGRR